MQMDAGLDTGPMLLQRARCRSRPTTLAARCTIDWRRSGASRTARGARWARSRHDSAAADSLPRASLTPRRSTKPKRCIDWDRATRVEIERQVRAFNPWPIAETRFDGEQLRDLCTSAPSRRCPSALLLAGQQSARSCGLERCHPRALRHGRCLRRHRACSGPAAARCRPWISRTPAPLAGQRFG